MWGQLSIFLTFFFVLFLYFVRKGEMCAAGLALTPLTTKPHLFFLLAVPGLAWLAQLPARQRRAFLAGAVGGLAVMLTITVLRWPEALPWWKASLSATPTGPGAVAMETWKTSTLSTLVRSVMADATGAAPRWPMWAIPLVGFVTTAFVFARRRDPIVWADVAPPLMCLSLTLGCYGWTYDQTLLLPVQMALACDAVAAHDRAAAWRVAGVLIAVQVLAVVIGARSGAAHDDFIWLPWAMFGVVLRAPAVRRGRRGRRLSRTPGLRHIPALDGLRGLAVAAVVLFHTGNLRGASSAWTCSSRCRAS